jgi:hypothetical protein
MSQPYAYATADRTTPPMVGGPIASENWRGSPDPPPSADRTPQVSTEMNRLHGLVDLAAANGKLLDELKDRLAPVLRPHPMANPVGANGACQAKQSELLAPLAADIRDIGERIGDRLHEANVVLRWLLDALGV